jgi:hypothetical protein
MLCFVCLPPVSCAHCCLCLWIVYSNYFLFVSTLTLGLLYGLVLCSRRWSNYCRQSRDIGNNGHKTQDEDKQNTTYKTKKMRSTRPLFYMLCFVCLRPVSCAHCCLCLWIVYSNYFIFVSTLTLARRWNNYCRQSRDTGNNGPKTQDEDKQNTTYKTKKMRSTRPYNKLLIFFVLYVVFCFSSSCVLCPLLPVSLDCLQ